MAQAQDKTLREYKKCPKTPSQGIFYIIVDEQL
jgi:hypothetical protein